MFRDDQMMRIIKKITTGTSYIIDKTAVLHATANIVNHSDDRNAIKIGAFTHIRGEILTFRHGGKIEIGDYCFIGNNSYIWSARHIRIGNRVLISHNCNIFDSDTHPLDPHERHLQCKAIITGSHPKNISLREEEITIEDDVWIGANSIIMKGVFIGKAAVVGAGSVVTKNVEPFTIVVGNPAKVVGTIPHHAQKQMTWEDAVLWLRRQPEHVKLVRDSFYDDPLIEAAERYYQSTEWRAVRKYLPSPPGKALDLGAGRGISAYAFARDGWETVALEPDSSPIVGAEAIRRLVQEVKLNVDVRETWGETLPFEDNIFDVVYCRQTLHHANDLAKLCKEMARVLKKGGTFIASREHVISSYEDLQAFLDQHPLHRKYGGENAFLLKEYKTAIANAGLILTSILNPFASDINLFPNTAKTFKVQIAKKIFLPFSSLIPNIALAILGTINRTPGRIFTFIGHKD